MTHALRTMGALWLAGARSAASYPVAQVISVAGLAAAVVPLFLIGSSLQPFMEGIVRVEGGEYFPFLLVGNALLMLVAGALSTPAGAIGGAIGSGSLESMLATSASPASVVVGLNAYALSWSVVRALVLLLAGAVVGVRYAPAGAGAALLLGALVLAVYFGIGLLEAAVVVAFRAGTPLPRVALVLSVLLGGVYYPVTSAPHWLQGLAAITPLGYGLRAVRRTLLAGEPLSAVSHDLAMLVAMSAAALAFGTLALALALRRARRTGSLGAF
jgi:ABC-2 type transport system permease protein